MGEIKVKHHIELGRDNIEVILSLFKMEIGYLLYNGQKELEK
jgi:hypothetical protein